MSTEINPAGIAPGVMLDERYEVQDLVGTGGSAEVWRATDARLGRDVAVKVLSGPAARDPRHRDRIEREARALASLTSRGVVHIYDYGEQPSVDGAPIPYLVMELVDGPDLAAKLHSDGPLAPAEAVEMMSAILGAVESSHGVGVIHGDLKPANVYLSGEGPKVGDFGVARILAAETGHTVPAATPSYAAPEVLRGQRPTPASDVYAAGCIAFELLTGRTPFIGDSFYALSHQHLNDEPPLVGSLQPVVPIALQSAVSSALAKEPEARPQSAAAFAQLLEASLSTPLEPAAVVTQPVTPLGVAPTMEVPREHTEVLAPRPQRKSVVALASGALFSSLRRVPIGIAVALLAIIALAVMRDAANASIRVPALVNLTADQAKAAAEKDGFKTEVTDVEQGGVAGTVVAQDPSPDSLLKRGGTIALSVTKGAPQATVPDLTGMKVDEATKKLEEAKLARGDVVYSVDSGKPAGTVVETRPGAGTSVDEGSAVELVVAAVPVDTTPNRPSNQKGRGKKDD